MWLNEKYSSNLQVLLVCRRFHDDFTNLAYERTRFVLPVWPAIRVGKIPSDKVHLIRKLAIASDWANICEWTQYPFNNLNIHLDELIVAFNDNSYDPRMVETLRSLRNVKMLGFVRNENYDARSCQIILYKLIGALLQKDHWCRYDAPNGPHIEKTWWDWRFDEGGYGVQLFAREPEPAMPEKEYLALMQPRIDEVMAGMARASS